MDTLDQLILKTLNPDSPEFSYTIQDIQTYETIVKTLDVTLKDSIYGKVLAITTEAEIACFIRNYQGHLIYLSDCVTSYNSKVTASHENDLHSGYNQLLEQVSNLVVGMLYFLHSYFATYFDQDKEITDAVREKAKKRFAPKIAELICLGDFMNDKLLQTVLLPAFEFQSDDPEYIATFRKITYLEVLLKEILLALKSGEDFEEALKWKLIYLNFNSLLFFCYVQKELKETIRLKGGDTARIRILRWYLKQINQIGEKTGFALNPKAKPINDRLSEWIKEEISYIEKYPSIHDQESDPSNGKIKIDSSVQQLGIVIEIIVKMGFVAEKDRRSLVRAFSVIFQTKQALNISENSLYNKSKEPESGTLAWAKDKLIKAINLVNHEL